MAYQNIICRNGVQHAVKLCVYYYGISEYYLYEWCAAFCDALCLILQCTACCDVVCNIMEYPNIICGMVYGVL